MLASMMQFPPYALRQLREDSCSASDDHLVSYQDDLMTRRGLYRRTQVAAEVVSWDSSPGDWSASRNRLGLRPYSRTASTR